MKGPIGGLAGYLKRSMALALPVIMMVVVASEPVRADVTPAAAIAQVVELANRAVDCANGDDTFCAATRDLALAIEHYVAFCVSDSLNALGVGQTAAAAWPTSLGCATRTTQTVEMVAAVEAILTDCDLTTPTGDCTATNDLLLLSVSLLEGCTRETVNAADVGLSIPGDDNLACGPLASATLAALADAEIALSECDSGRSAFCATLVRDIVDALTSAEGCADGTLSALDVAPVTGATDPGCATPVTTAVATAEALGGLVSDCANGTDQTCIAIAAAAGAAVELVVTSLERCLDGTVQACADAQSAADAVAGLVAACANTSITCVQPVIEGAPSEVAEDTPQPCIPTAPNAVTFISPTGVESSIPTPGAATVTHYRDADGTESTDITPPPGFTPMTAPLLTLDAFGFPERPDPASEEYDSYQATWGAYTAPAPPGSCTVPGGPVYYTDTMTDTGAGYELSTTSTALFRRLNAVFTVPTFEAHCTSASSVSSWVSFGRDPIIQAGVATFGELQNSRVFFETAGADEGYTHAQYLNIAVAPRDAISVYLRYRSDLSPVRVDLSVINKTTGVAASKQYTQIGNHSPSYWYDGMWADIFTERPMKEGLRGPYKLRWFGQYKFSDVYVKRASDQYSKPVGTMTRSEAYARDPDNGHITHDVNVPLSGPASKMFATRWLRCD